MTKMDSQKGVKGCVWIQNQVCPRVGHSEACRGRIEEQIAEDTSGEREQKANKRLEHFLAQKIERDDPQNNEPSIEKQEAPPPEIAINSHMETQHFEIHSPARRGRDLHEDELEDGPTGVSERR